MRSRHRVVSLVAALAAYLVASGCSVSGPDGEPVGQRTDGGSATIVAEGSQAADQVAGSGSDAPGDALATTGAQRPSRGGGVGTGTASGESGASPLARIPTGAGVHGVTDTEIEFGIWVYNSDQAVAVIGALSGDPSVPSDPDQDAASAAQGVVDYINAQGGAAGRTIKPIYHKLDVAAYVTPSGRQQEVQKACATWTEDHHVFGFMELGYGQGLTCAKNTKTVVVAGRDAGVGWLSKAMFEEAHDLWYAPNWMLSERRERNLVESLWGTGFFGQGAKVGILLEDREGTKEGVARGMVPALAAHGLKPVIQIAYPDSTESPWQNYVLQLQSAGATHVLMAGTEATWLSTVFAMRAADNQRYIPRWGIASDNGPYGVLAYGPRSQVANTRGLGWIPGVDVSDPADQSPTGALCRKIGETTGHNPAMYCDTLFFFDFVLDRVQQVSPRAMSDALARVGGGYQSSATIGGATSLGPDQHDGAVRGRDFAFDKGCSCFHYTSPPKLLL